ncbi:DUF5675 family protein [Aquiflexum lacus]|uniref:DUF5675 family protein n=1 Tax=Aquiflexum lacus TaxID=2483805 RepID=UPI00189338B4|nr:DUF5675 family protein [Aquiflexum lacus]
MKKFAAILIIALLAILVLVIFTNPEVLGKAWLYVLGFIGYVVVLVENGFKKIAVAFTGPKENKPDAPQKPTLDQNHESHEIAQRNKEIALLQQRIKDLEIKLQESQTDDGTLLGKCTLTVLRYIDDGETTLGLIFLRNKFFAYTLEDTHREEKIRGKTRISPGIYTIGYSPVDPAQSRITRDYLRIYSPWFTKHLHLKNVPDFEGIYIHVGNNHENTEGCILIADGVSAGTQQKMLQSSRSAYQRFYKIISALLDSNEQVNIQILNEDWFDRSKLTSL